MDNNGKPAGGIGKALRLCLGYIVTIQPGYTEQAARDLAKDSCAEDELDFERFDSVLLTPLCENRSVLMEGLTEVFRNMPAVADRLDEKRCFVSSAAGVTRCRELEETIEHDLEAAAGARSEDEGNAFWKTSGSLAAAVILLLLAGLCAFVPFSAAFFSKAWAPVLAVIGVICVLSGCFTRSWTPLKVFIGLTLLAYIILRVVRAGFRIDPSVDLIGPVFRWGVTAFLVLIAVFIFFCRRDAARTEKEAVAKALTLARNFRRLYVEASYVLNRVSAAPDDLNNPLFAYEFSLALALQSFYSHHEPIPLITRNEVVRILVRSAEE